MEHNLKLDPAMDGTLTELRERYIRAHGLKAAVDFTTVELSFGGTIPDEKTLLERADRFAAYIRDGMMGESF